MSGAAAYDTNKDKREEVVRINALTAEHEKIIVDVHNKLRRQEGASDMEKLSYNSKIAALAQTWSQGCVFDHGNPPFNQADIGYAELSQNIFISTDPTFRADDAVLEWYKEKADFFYDEVQCTEGKMCGHYTAVTWAKINQVGCGVTFCPFASGYTDAYLFVCNYAPVGNYEGEKPFKKGPACSKCNSGSFFCNDNLCDSSCTTEGDSCKCSAACQHCGKVTGSCKCDCIPGSRGVDCADVCEDKDPLCGANPGFPQSYCDSADPEWAFIRDSCPKMCNICKGGDLSACKA